MNIVRDKPFEMRVYNTNYLIRNISEYGSDSKVEFLVRIDGGVKNGKDISGIFYRVGKDKDKILLEIFEKIYSGEILNEMITGIGEEQNVS